MIKVIKVDVEGDTFPDGTGGIGQGYGDTIGAKEGEGGV